MKNKSILLIITLCLCVCSSQAAEKIKVACVGNSVTYGYGLQDREHDSYPVRLQQMLGKGYEVGNFGHSGATLLYKGHRPYIGLPEFHQALDFKPDWVVIHLGLNDTDPRNWPDWKEEFIPNYRALIDSFRLVNPEARILVCKMTPIFDRHPRFQSGTRDWHAQVQKAIEQVAHGAGAQLIDLFTPLHNRPDLFPDALHPNPEGAKILAKTVYSALTGDYGGLHLPPVYSSGMVLPRDEPLLLEGRANARSKIRRVLSKDGKVLDEGETFSRADGTWSMEMSEMKAGGPYTLTFTATPLNPDHYHFYYPEKYPYLLDNLTKAEPQTLTIDSLYFGDIWLASGQIYIICPRGRGRMLWSGTTACLPSRTSCATWSSRDGRQLHPNQFGASRPSPSTSGVCFATACPTCPSASSVTPWEALRRSLG